MKICQSTIKVKRKRISYYEFCMYLMGPHNCIVGEDYYNFKTDENQPLTHYFINSSRKTYLATDSKSSKPKKYIEDLENGVRHVEIECYDSRDGPIVAVSEDAKKFMNYLEVLKEIKEFCTKNKNHTPIILKIVNNCT